MLVTPYAHKLRVEAPSARVRGRLILQELAPFARHGDVRVVHGVLGSFCPSFPVG